MTAAPAAATAAAPSAPPPVRATSQPSADPFAFAAVLDTLPGAPAKTGASTAEEQAHRSKEPPQDPSSGGQTARHPLPNDSALMASLPFALRAAAMMNGLPQAEQSSSSPASPAIKGPESEDNVVSAASGKTASAGRLIGERAFHLGATANRTLAVNAPTAPAVAADLNIDNASLAGFSLAMAIPATPAADAVPPVANATVSSPTASRTGAPASSNRGSLTRAAAHAVARSAAKPEGSAPPAPHASGSTSPPTPAGPNAKAVDDRLPDPTASSAPSPMQTTPFGGELSASLAIGASLEPDASTTDAASADAAPRAAALATGSASSTHPVKEIDVDLSPSGLEDVSMTMRLAGDRLSVVIRAASSQTLGSIEGARDAISDRLAAIGQPLDSLIVKQTGVNTNGTTNANGASAEDGSTEGAGRPAQGAGEWTGSGDALSRRGAGRDRSF